MCFHNVFMISLVFYFSQFFTGFFNYVYVEFVYVLVGIDCVTDKLKATFFKNEKHTLLSSNLFPRMLKVAFFSFRALKFQNFLG